MTRDSDSTKKVKSGVLLLLQKKKTRLSFAINVHHMMTNSFCGNDRMIKKGIENRFAKFPTNLSSFLIPVVSMKGSDFGSVEAVV